jgi:hypothetical protein
MVLVSYQSSVGKLIYRLFLTKFDRSVGQTQQTMFTMACFWWCTSQKMILTLLLLGEDIFRIGAGSKFF